MDKKSKEAIRRYKKNRTRDASSSESSSSSDSDTGSSSSYSSSESERKSNAVRRHRKKKMTHSDEEKRKKREHCQKKLEAKRDHLKRKLKEAKLKRRAAAAAAVLSGHSHRSSLSPLTQAKLKKLAERRHLREVSKERREREKQHLVRERARERSRSASKMAKLRLHATKSPQRMHQQMMSREKIIIQTRTHERTPSIERERERERDRERNQRHNEHKMLRHDDRRDRERERAEREAARDKERAEALARCQERQRERERIAREKLRREEEQKKYGTVVAGNERNPSLINDYDMMIYHGNHTYNERDRDRERERDRERSLEALERTRYNTKRELDLYERDCKYMETERRVPVDDNELRHERDTATRRHETSPGNERYMPRVRDVRDMYTDEERDRSFNRAYHAETLPLHYTRERNNWPQRDMRDSRETGDYSKREHEHNMYEEHHDQDAALLRERERTREQRKSTNQNEWKSGNWEHNEWSNMNMNVPIATPNKLNNRNEFNDSFQPHANESANVKNENRADSEPDWDADEHKDNNNKYATEQLANNQSRNDNINKETWHDNKMNTNFPSRDNMPLTNEWQHTDLVEDVNQQRLLGNNVNFNRPRSYRERTAAVNFRAHGMPLLNVPVAQPRTPFHGIQRPLNKRNMTYTNPNILKKQQAAMAAAKAVAAATAVAAAKAAAQSAANATTNPGILGQVRQYQMYADKPEPGEIVGEDKSNEDENKLELEKISGELSEISDSDDEILNNIENKKTLTNELTTLDIKPTSDIVNVVCPNTTTTTTLVNVKSTELVGNEDEDMLAFEEISDGEFEEDTRLKNVADALGVDWASLIAESKAQATENIKNSNEMSTTSAKQRWQAHRVLLNVGISFRLAGEEFAKRLLNETQAKLDAEAANEMEETALDDTKTEEVKPNIVKLETESILKTCFEKPLAFSQVYARQSNKLRNQMFTNVCGAYSRALSARQDLRLRRQLCGLPADDCEISKPLPLISDKLKTMALNAFKCALEVK